MWAVRELIHVRHGDSIIADHRTTKATPAAIRAFMIGFFVQGQKILQPSLTDPGTRYRPTVSLDVISLVASSCGHYRSQIEQCAAHECAVHVVSQRRRAKWLQHRHVPRAQPIAPMQERHCRRPRLTPEVLHRAGTLSRAGTPPRRTQEEKRPNRLTIQRDVMPARLSSFRLLAMASPDWMLVGSS
jgi:hypothetical protein